MVQCRRHDFSLTREYFARYLYSCASVDSRKSDAGANDAFASTVITASRSRVVARRARRHAGVCLSRARRRRRRRRRRNSKFYVAQ